LGLVERRGAGAGFVGSRGVSGGGIFGCHRFVVFVFRLVAEL
jgi:hypothetical protein